MDNPVHGINAIELGVESRIEDKSHARAEFYLPNYYCMPADPTGNVFANTDNLRIVLSFGNNVVLDPPCVPLGRHCDDGIATFIVYPFFRDPFFKFSNVE